MRIRRLECHVLLGIGAAALQACSAEAPMSRRDAGATSQRDGDTSTNNTIPCEPKKVVDTACLGCHSAPPKFGAPMSLATWDDFQRPSKSNPSLKVYESADDRIHRTGTGRMPEDRVLTASELDTLGNWFGSGAAAGKGCEGTEDAGVSSDAGADAGGNDVTSPPPDAGPTGEECFEFRAHGKQAAGDTTPFASSQAEFYTCFNFTVPWTKPMQGVTFTSLLDNTAVVHHWLLYQNPLGTFDGTFANCVGAHPGMALLTGWAPGGKDLALPPDVGLELPTSGQSFQLEVHYYNAGGQAFQDRSGVRICATPNFRKNTASITWAGTEKINIAPRSQGTAAGKCVPSRKGLGPTDPVHVMYQWPHGHKLLTRMQTLINRAGGTVETLHDRPFTFANQTTYDTPALIYPGDSLTTTCWYDNTTTAAVSFGPSTTQEMCYAFIYAWPAHALDGRSGISGAANTCIE
jgi:hypothetical protein